MGYEKEEIPSVGAEGVHLVQATSANGSVVSRDAFITRAESDAHAEKLRAEGYTVEQTTLPKP